MNRSKMKLKRINKGLTQQDLGKVTNTGLTTIVKLEKGEIEGTRVRTLQKIARALDTNVIDLFFSEDE